MQGLLGFALTGLPGETAASFPDRLAVLFHKGFW